MAFQGYRRGQTIGRFMRYLYDGYRIAASDRWQFGSGRVMSGSVVVAEIIEPADCDDAPLFNFLGDYAYLNDIQGNKRLRTRAEEIREIIVEGFDKYREIDEEYIEARREYRFHKQFDFDTAQQKALEAKIKINVRESVLREKFERLREAL